VSISDTHAEALAGLACCTAKVYRTPTPHPAGQWPACWPG